MPQVSLDQRRLETLRRQLYGKEKVASSKISRDSQPKSGPAVTTTFSLPEISVVSSNTQDIGFLKADLSKVAILSALALGVQVLLFVLSRNHLVNLSFHF